MKTNLDSIFKTDKSLETEGMWFVVKEGVEFQMRRFGGYNESKIKAAMAIHYKPYARLFENGTMSSDKQREIMIKVFVDACLIGWKGVEVDGKEVEFSKDAAVELLNALPDLYEKLNTYASDQANYREDVGNS